MNGNSAAYLDNLEDVVSGLGQTKENKHPDLLLPFSSQLQPKN